MGNLVFWSTDEWFISYKEFMVDGKPSGWHIAIPHQLQLRPAYLVFVEEEGIYEVPKD